MGWFRKYPDKWLTDVKVQSLTHAQRGLLDTVFCLRAIGELPHADDDQVFAALRIGRAAGRKLKALFLRNGFIDESWDVRNWDKYQYQSDCSTPRVRAFRERERRVAEQAETENETAMKRFSSVTETPPDPDPDPDQTSSLRSEVSAEPETEPGSASAPPAGVAPETTVEATVERLRNAERLPDALRDVVVTAPEPPDSRHPEKAATAPEREPPLHQAVALLPVVGPPHERVDARGYYLVCTEQVSQWEGWYPELDLRRELERMASWLEANPRQRKTARGIPRFVRNWLDREANNPRGRRAATSGLGSEAEYAAQANPDPEAQAKREREELAASRAQGAAELAAYWRAKLARNPEAGERPRNGNANGMRSMRAVLESLERQAGLRGEAGAETG
jgi:hypothetical protein